MRHLEQKLYAYAKDNALPSVGFSDLDSIEKFREKCHHESLDSGTLTILKIRDALIVCGHILEEDLDNNYYIAIVSPGNSKLKVSLLIVELLEKKVNICAYAREGLIKQNIAKKSIAKLTAALQR